MKSQQLEGTATWVLDGLAVILDDDINDKLLSFVVRLRPLGPVVADAF